MQKARTPQSERHYGAAGLLSRGLAISGILLGLAGPVSAAVTVLPQGSTVGGKTIADWSTDWWTWLFAQSGPNNSIADTTGAFAGVGQSGPVYNLAGTLGGLATRSFNVPWNAYLLAPMLNSEASEAELGYPQTYETLLAANVAGMNGAVDSSPGITSLTAKIGGADIVPGGIVPLVHASDCVTPNSVHCESSGLFSFTYAPNNPFGLPAGPSGNAQALGYYMMLAPIGNQTITLEYGGSFGVIGEPPIYETEVIATITGVPEPATLGLVGFGLAGLTAIRRRGRT